MSSSDRIPPEESRAGTRPAEGPGSLPFSGVLVIAEIANAHEGDFARAEALVDAAEGSGAEAVKFQVFTAQELVVATHPRRAHFARLEFAPEQWASLVERARAANLRVFADVFGLHSGRLMHDLGVDGFKIHSSDVPNTPLLEYVAGCGRTVLLSAGGSTAAEIRTALRTLRAGSAAPLILMHGFQSFPTRLEDTDLRRIPALRQTFGLPVGFMDHVDAEDEAALFLPLMAIACGAVVIEKHITLDRSLRGIDYYSSLNPPEFARLVALVRRLEAALGSGELALLPAEAEYRHTMKKSLVAAREIPAGTPLTAGDVTYRRTGTGGTSPDLEAVLGLRTVVRLAPDEPITAARLEHRIAALIAVRLHSTRLPRKALLTIKGRTLLEHLVDRVRLARTPDVIVVCTSTHPDDKPLIDLSERIGVSWFAGSEDDVMDRFIQAAEREHADVIVRITGDDVLIDPVHLDRAVHHHLTEHADYTYIDGLPSGTEVEVISTSALRRAHRLAEDSRWTEYMTWYLRRPDYFRVAVLRPEERFRRPYRLTVDEREDYELLCALLERLPRADYSLEELLEILDRDAALRAINSHVRPKDVRHLVNTNLRETW